MSLSDSERGSLIEAATSRKLGDLSNWTRPELAHTFGQVILMS